MLPLRIKPAELIEGIYRKYLEEPDTREVVPSYFLGEVGILLVLWRMTGSPEAARRLQDAIRENIPNPVNEALWAAPGTMVGALHMHDWTGEREWQALFLENVEQLLDRRIALFRICRVGRFAFRVDLGPESSL